MTSAEDSLEVEGSVADYLSTERRSVLMSSIRGRDTSLEIYVRRAIWAAGFRYRLHSATLPGKPDLVLPRYRTATFVQGCFWHRHWCSRGRSFPKTNEDFWRRKLNRNLERDELNHAKIKSLGWTVHLIWECSLQAGTESLLTHLRELRTQSE